MRYVSFALFASTIPAANWLIGNVGDCSAGPCVIPVGFGLMAPSGVLMIGLALVLRDWLQETAGRLWAVAAIALGCILSLATSPAALAIASAAAFAVAELCDMAVYSRFRARGMVLAVLLSGMVGAVVDSALFVWLAFGSFEFSLGTALAKVYATAAVAVVLAVWSRLPSAIAAGVLTVIFLEVIKLVSPTATLIASVLFIVAGFVLLVRSEDR